MPESTRTGKLPQTFETFQNIDAVSASGLGEYFSRAAMIHNGSKWVKFNFFLFDHPV